MVSYWKSTVVPSLKKIFQSGKSKKKACAEAIKDFDSQKAAIDAEVEEKKADLHPKVVEYYKSSATEIKILLKDPKETVVLEKTKDAEKCVQGLVDAGFPGASKVCEITKKYGAASAAGVVSYLLVKASVFVEGEEAPAIEIPAEEPKAEEIAPPAEEKKVEIAEKSCEEAAEEKIEAPAESIEAPAPESIPALEEKPTSESAGCSAADPSPAVCDPSTAT